MRIILKKEKINSVRLDINEHRIYFIDKKPKFLEHDTNRNWGYIYNLYMYKFKEYYKFVDIRNEYVMGCGKRPDGIIGFRNYVTNEFRYVIIESDRVESRNKFTKIKDYVDIYRSNNYKGEFWYDRVKRFPHILIVCNNDKKKLKVLEYVERDNIEFRVFDKSIGKEVGDKLKFIVITVSEIKKYLFDSIRNG